MKNLQVFLWLAVSMVVLPNYLLAASIGQMELVAGVVKLTRAQSSVVYDTPVKNIPVMAGDRFHTGDNTRVKLALRDNAEQVTLFSQSNLQVKTYDSGGVLYFLNLGKAYFGAFIKKIRTRFKVQTPTAAIGVKGTEFVVGAEPDRTFLLTVEGLVGFAGSGHPDTEALVGIGTASVVSAGGTPSDPVAVSSQVQQEILNSDGNGAFQQIDFGTATSGSGQASGVAAIESAVSQQSAGVENVTSQPSGTGDGNLKFDVKNK